MKSACVAGILLSLAAGGAHAQPSFAPATPPADGSAPIEIVKRDVDLEAAADGRSWKVVEVHYRPLTSQGVEALQKFDLSFTQGYEDLRVVAYTLKKDGRRIDIPQDSMLKGRGNSTSPGFEDTLNVTVVFPNLEIGDQAVMITRSEQLVPWFPDIFADTQTFPRQVVVKEANFAFTSQGKDNDFHIYTKDVETDAPMTAGGKTRHAWHYRNSAPRIADPEALDDLAGQPHVAITTLRDWSQMAALYVTLFKGRAEVTPEIAKLANELTAGETDKRAQARKLYDWVSSHIRYVNIVLGAGGFLPHKAADVLTNGYGDCKDHVMLLEALLAAKGIKSSPVLIRAADKIYKLPPAASPYVFDHLISYIPEFQLFADSTAQFAPFGVLPFSGAGKEVVIVSSGKVARTPAVTAANSLLSAVSTVNVNADGSADIDTAFAATGAMAVDMRGMMTALPPERDNEFFRALGPGSSGKFQRDPSGTLGERYEFSARYHLGHVVNMPGPGALPAALAYKPFSFGQLAGQNLPPSRQDDYVCASGTFVEDVTATLPAAAAITALPQSKTITAQGTVLDVHYENPAPNIVKQRVVLKLDRPPVCRAQDYAAARPGLSSMMSALFAQTLYK
ncbi:MAG: DUF3857 domain-containing protein [Rhizomicrobium sp.]